MQWDAGPDAGFTSGTPWIAVNPNYPDINARAQTEDPESVFAHYRALIELRHNEPVVAYGDFRMLLPTDPVVYAFTRSWRGRTLLVVGNFSAEPAPAPVPNEPLWAAAELVLGNYPPPMGVTDQIVLRQWEARIYRQAT